MSYNRRKTHQVPLLTATNSNLMQHQTKDHPNKTDEDIALLPPDLNLIHNEIAMGIVSLLFMYIKHIYKDESDESPRFLQLKTCWSYHPASWSQWSSVLNHAILTRFLSFTLQSCNKSRELQTQGSKKYNKKLQIMTHICAVWNVSN